jgi:hypothetical protein
MEMTKFDKFIIHIPLVGIFCSVDIIVNFELTHDERFHIYYSTVSQSIWLGLAVIYFTKFY